ncbi:IPT/TIG domain-containing protein [Micromonospora sp. NPDC050397]|uniref:IPT/TIG domain-containing protein n=1 Tax=Micromonospora sp. NPDC050397 TaxID=3364279 RepID=UPI00384BD121
MRPIWRTTVAAGLAVAVTAATTLTPAAPAHASPGGASVTVADTELYASTLDVTLLQGRNYVEYSAPDTPGSTVVVDEIFGLGSENVGGGGLVRRATVTREPGLLTASVEVEGFSLTLFDVTAITAERMTSTVRCPTFGTPTTETTLTNLRLFGEPVELVPNGPAVTRSSPVDAFPVFNAQVHLTVRRSHTTGSAHTAAFPIDGDLRMTGLQFDGRPFAQDVGFLNFGGASCSEEVPPPVVTAIVPDAGTVAGEQRVTITGENFAPGDTRVSFGGRLAQDVTVAPDRSSLTALTPPGDPGPVEVRVETRGGTSAPVTYTYQYDGSRAQARNIVPTSGPTAGGTLVVINGYRFEGATGVTFDGLPGTDFTLNPAGTRITVVTPTHEPGPVPVRLVFPAGTATAPEFTYVPPTATGVSPDQGPSTGGTRVTISGTGLDRATGVTFGGIPGTDLSTGTALSTGGAQAPSGAEATLSVTTPPGPVGPVDVVVELPGPDATVPAGFRYLLAAPSISTVDPDRGPTSGGTTVRVDGSGFVPGQTTVTSCGRVIVAGSVTVAPDGLSLTFTTPPCAAGSSAITVTTPAGTSASAAFRYVAGGLPVTGTPARILFAVALTLIVAGIIAVRLLRRSAIPTFTP